MKKLLVVAMLALSSASFAGFTPEVILTVGNDKTIYVQINNDSGADLECKYRVSWLINATTYNREFGSFFIAKDSTYDLIFKNDIYARLSKIKVKVDCE